ncbi:uncharacterized protein LOC110862874 [Folsomia candida]|uniref:GTPase Era n=1 Tax=Folsomia candida TaxID=158441 RepID=A0A226EWN4_FOLCA|nr:uncharacterized protein LOC110862874 [Folsomia candida]OXA61567.1 GTPase Era [Folsomia candida]
MGKFEVIVIAGVVLYVAYLYQPKPPLPVTPDLDFCPSEGFEEKTQDALKLLRNDQEKNVIVFGETGVGKSSLINMIVDKQIAETSDKAVGCTFEHQKYSFLNYNIFDTVGLGEPEGGTVSTKDAVGKLLELITVLKSSPGINLLILVMKKGRITESLKTNYELFVNIMTEKKVPVFLVITHADGEKEKNKWYVDNVDHFRRHKAHFHDVTTVCAKKGENVHKNMQCYFKNCYAESRYNVLTLIKKYSLAEPYQIRGLTFSKRVASMVNIITDFFGYPRTLWEELYEFLLDLGFSDVDARRKSNALFN